jgi:hypothetical protein
MIDHRRDYDENDEALERHRHIVELMQKRAINNRQETYVQFGLIIAAVLLASALFMAMM